MHPAIPAEIYDCVLVSRWMTSPRVHCCRSRYVQVDDEYRAFENATRTLRRLGSRLKSPLRGPKLAEHTDRCGGAIRGWWHDPALLCEINRSRPADRTVSENRSCSFGVAPDCSDIIKYFCYMLPIVEDNKILGCHLFYL